MISLETKIHQVVILNISDHYTRNKIQYPDRHTRVFGALFGTPIGNQLQVLGSFEGVGKIDDKGVIVAIDMNYINKRITLLKEVYKTSELIGWYSISSDMIPLSNDLEIHKQFLPYVETPIYLCYDPNKKMKNSFDLPLKLYELKIKNGEKGPIYDFSEMSCEIEAEVTENTCIEHLTKNLTGASSSVFGDTLSTTVSAVTILSNKIQELIQYIEKNPQSLLEDPNLFREIKELCINFPSDDNNEYKHDLMNEFKETTTINMLTSLFVANKTIQDVLHLKMGFDIRSVKSFLDTQGGVEAQIWPQDPYFL